MKFWVTMGYYDDGADGRIVELDCTSRSIVERVHFQPPAAGAVPGRGFTGGTWMGPAGASDYLVCSATAVHRIDGHTKQIVGSLSLPSFNDLHGVAVHDRRIYVVNTGLDCIDVFDLSGRFVGTHSFESAWLAAQRQRGVYPSRVDWDRLQQRGWRTQAGPENDRVTADSQLGQYYSQNTELPFARRKVRDHVHPNHICFFAGRALVTSLARRAVIDLATFARIAQPSSPPHDGQIVDDQLWLTAIDGHVECYEARAARFELVRRIDVSAATGIFGWCRGLWVGDEHIAVGFTEIRQRQRYAWERAPWNSTMTAVVVVAQADSRLLHLFDLTDRARHSKVYTISEAP